ncbi:MAG: cell division ATP-binding protein FtsE [Erysipelotrichaceae bacterium]|nr:cell division ATP-binding protein FtsE [Erysipelotrichaceae bacterium]
MITLTNVGKTYKNGVNALYDINLSIDQGEFVYIIGPTGSGKSTLIKLLDGEEIPSKGTVMVGDTNVGKLKHRKVPYYRRSIGVVFQDFRLLPSKTVYENISYALEVLVSKEWNKKNIRNRVRQVMNLVGLDDKGNSFPSELSGGQQQRTSIARAIANRPKVLIADEPTGNLDPKMSDEIMTLLEKINREEGTTILMVTHDLTIVNRHRKRTLVLEEGHLVADLQDGGYVQHDR